MGARDERCVSRRAALRAAVAATGAALGAGPAPARAEDAGAAGSADGSGGTFFATFTAWPGYATTMDNALATVAVPVGAPASGELAWEGEAGSWLPLALRQKGQDTYVYAAQGGSLRKLSVATGEAGFGERDELELPGEPAAPGRAAFSGASLVVALAAGRFVAIDEDLALAWEGEAVEPPRGEAAWDNASQVVPGEGAVLAAWVLDADGARSVALAACSSLDGSLLWRRDWEVPLAAEDPAPCAPGLFTVEGGYLLCDGASTLRLVSGEGEELATLDMAERGACALRAVVPADGGLPGGAAAIAARLADGSDAVGMAWLATDGSARLSLAALPDAYPVADPVVSAGRVLVVAASAAGGGLRAFEPSLPESADGAVEVGVGVGLPGVAEPVCAVPLATVLGTDAASAQVDVLVVDAYGAVARVSRAAGEDGSWEAEGLRAAAPAALDTAPSPLAARDGTVVLALPDEGGGARLAALAPDADRAAATPVGGSDGLDTMGGLLTGVRLPGGAGLGAGALLLAATFGAYAYVRNRGGAAARDEGLEAWRREHGREARGRAGEGPDGDGRRP